MNERYEIWTLDENGFPMDMIDSYDSKEEAINDCKDYKRDYERNPNSYFDVVLYQRIM